LRRAYGGNTLHGDRSDDVDVDVDGAASRPNWRRWTRWRGGGNNAFHSRCIASISPILRAFYDQLKEPLILMLLFSASISLCLGNGADALSIGMALVIVSLVAAIQEYRSERGEVFLLLYAPFYFIGCVEGRLKVFCHFITFVPPSTSPRLKVIVIVVVVVLFGMFHSGILSFKLGGFGRFRFRFRSG
jgi:hypothetical protein